MTQVSNIEYCSEITVELVDHMGGDWSVISAAKVSVNPEEAKRVMDEKNDDGRGLIKFLMRNRHGTPFEHGCLSFWVDAPIFVWREWHRHRIGMSYNEESGRWSQLRPKFYIPYGLRPLAVAPGSKPSKPILEPWPFEKYDEWRQRKQFMYALAYHNYLNDLELGVAKEVARITLPVGIYSRCWVTMNPRSLMHFLSLRTHNEQAKYISNPQWEIEVAALAVEKVFAEHWPLTYEAFNECGRVAP